MGFSASGAALVVFAALFVALGTMYTTTATSLGRLEEAEAAQVEHAVTIQDTQVEVTEATWDGGAGTLTVRVNNTGETTLSTEETSVLVDGQYLPLSAFETVTVDGHDSRRWGPGASLLLEDTDDSVGAVTDTPPVRVKVVTGPGVAAVEEVRSV